MKTVIGATMTMRKKKINLSILYMYIGNRSQTRVPTVRRVCGCAGVRVLAGRRRRRVRRSEILQTPCLVQTRQQVLHRAGLLFCRCAQVPGSRCVTSRHVH